MSTANAFGGGGAKSKRLVADVSDSVKQNLIPALEKATGLAERFQRALQGSNSNGNNTGASSMSGASQPSMGPSTGGPNLNTGSPIDNATNIGDFSGNAPSARQLGFSGSNSMSFSGVASAIRGVGNTILAAGVQMTQPDEFIMNDLARRRFGFYMGTGNFGTGQGSSAFQSMMKAGSPNEPLDAAKASMAGNSMGLMNGLSNYGTISQSVAGISNIMPGVGLTGGMNATAALNQGSSVNKLRMIGIQVRDNNGYMRGVEDIAKDLWNQLNKVKSGGSKGISAQDLSYSLQPGMSLDMMLNQYFNGDPVLRESIVAYLYQFASGKTTSKKDLAATGINPDFYQSITNRAASEYKVTDTFTAAGINGIQITDNAITATADSLAKVDGSAKDIVNTFVSVNTGLQTLAGAANGAAGILLAQATKAILNAGENNTVQTALDTGVVFAGGVVGTDMLKNLFGQTTAPSVDSPGGGPNNTGTHRDPGFYMTPSKLSMARTSAQLKTARNDWATKFIEAAGGKATAGKVAAVRNWMDYENTNDWNNPLASEYVAPGTTAHDMNSAGVQGYATEAAGIQAELGTLKSVPGVGYDAILAKLKDPKATEADVWSAVSASGWNGGHYGAVLGQTLWNGATINLNFQGDISHMNPTELAAAIKKAIDDATRTR